MRVHIIQFPCTQAWKTMHFLNRLQMCAYTTRFIFDVKVRHCEDNSLERCYKKWAFFIRFQLKVFCLTWYYKWILEILNGYCLHKWRDIASYWTGTARPSRVNLLTVRLQVVLVFLIEKQRNVKAMASNTQTSHLSETYSGEKEAGDHAKTTFSKNVQIKFQITNKSL